jgi:uncharacterized iron-regulated membrane protein
VDACKIARFSTKDCPLVSSYSMHFFTALALIAGFCVVLIVGLLSIFQDLMDRDFHAAPVVTERDAPGDRRYPAASSSAKDPSADVEQTFRMSGGQRG